jgi:hypothetical protein
MPSPVPPSSHTSALCPGVPRTGPGCAQMIRHSASVLRGICLGCAVLQRQPMPLRPSPQSALSTSQAIHCILVLASLLASAYQCISANVVDHMAFAKAHVRIRCETIHFLEPCGGNQRFALPTLNLVETNPSHVSNCIPRLPPGECLYTHHHFCCSVHQSARSGDEDAVDRLQCIEGLRWVVPGTKADKEPEEGDKLQFRQYAQSVVRRGRLS